jgi:hypothetical protein
MKNWNQFIASEPILFTIEARYGRLQELEQAARQQGYSASSDLIFDWSDARNILLEGIRREAERLPGKVYYWLYPFYRGDFLQLVAALGACGAMDQQRDDEESRLAFYEFFRSVPLEDRLELGQRLGAPRLARESAEIQQKIEERKTGIKQIIDQNFGN